MREFDVHIERRLENWTVAHDLREVIASALDGQGLTEQADPGGWLGPDGLAGAR